MKFLRIFLILVLGFGFAVGFVSGQIAGIGVPTFFPLSPLTTFNLPGIGSNNNFDVGDVNGDGIDEVVWLYGTVGGGNVNVYSGSGSLLFQTPLSTPAFSYIPSATLEIIGDVNGDNYRDIAIGAVDIINGNFVIIIISGNGGGFLNTIISSPTQSVYPYFTSTAGIQNLGGDYNSNGIPDFLVSETLAGSGGVIYIFDGSGLLIQTIQNPSSIGTFGGPMGFSSIGDINGDNIPEFAVANPGNPNIGAYVFNGGNGNILYSFPNLNPSSITGVFGDFASTFDYNNDLFPDVITTDSTVGGPGVVVNLKVFSGQDGSIISTLNNLGGLTPPALGIPFFQISDSNLNGDVYGEFITATPLFSPSYIGTYLYVFNGPFNSLIYRKVYFLQGALTSYKKGDVDGDGIDELVVWAVTGGVNYIETLKLLGVYPYPQPNTNSLTATWTPSGTQNPALGAINVIGLNPNEPVCVLVSDAPINLQIPGSIDFVYVDWTRPGAILDCSTYTADASGNVVFNNLNLQVPGLAGQKFYFQLLRQNSQSNQIEASNGLEITVGS